MLIGIGGPSRAGKTTLSRLLGESYSKSGLHIIVVHQDEHVVDEEELPMIRDKRDWEVPSSIDWASLYASVKQAMDLADVVIVEGLFCFHELRLTQLMDVKIFVEIDKDLFVHRKKEDLRWGSEAEPEWYVQHIWDSYERYGIPLTKEMDFTLDGTRYFDIELLVADIAGL